MFGLCSGLLFVCLSFLMFPPPTDGQGDGSDVLRVKEDDDVILPCDSGSKQNLERQTFDWKKVPQNGENQRVFVYDAGFHSNNDLRNQDEQFKGRVSHFPDQLKNGNASIMIRKTRLTDNGRYICTFPLFQAIREVHIDLFVDVTLKDRTGETSGAAPRPDVKLSHSRDKLQCDVKGVFPEPKVEWWDDAGNVLPAEEPRVTERGGSYSVTLIIDINTHPSVNQFLCVVTQSEISHQIHTEFNVVLHCTKETSYLIVIGVLICVLLIFAVLLVSCGVRMYRKRVLRQKREKAREEARKEAWEAARKEAWEAACKAVQAAAHKIVQTEFRQKPNTVTLESDPGPSSDGRETNMDSMEMKPLNTE